MSKPANLQELLRQAQISSVGQALLHDAAAPADGPERLFARGLDLDAVRLLAYTLPVRRAVWWGCLCTWHARGQPWRPAQEQALNTAVEWVFQPTAEVGRTALGAAEAAGLDNAAGCIARAAAAVGSLAEFKAADHVLAARAVQGSALYAQMERQKVEPAFTYRPLAALGLQVARGEILWDTHTLERKS